jgi:hypothetical protein
MIETIQEIGSHFNPDSYLVLTRIQGSLWTAADLIIVWHLLKIADLMRAYLAVRRHRVSYYALAATIPFALFLPVAPTGLSVFRIELFVTIPHFLIILYVLICDAQHAARALHRRLSSTPPVT